MKAIVSRLLVPLLAFGLSATAAAQHDHGAAHHDHGHAHGEKPPKPKLDVGNKKWATDAPLRKGMSEIKTLVEAAIPGVHAGKMSDEQFAALGKKVDEQISSIFANCKLKPEADAVLHGVLAQIMEGSRIVQTGDGKRSSGVVKMIRALDEYGSLFQHDGWKKVKH